MSRILIYLLSPLCFLPIHWQWALGRFIGRRLEKLNRHRRNVVDANIRICALPVTCTQIYEDAGCALFDTLNVWVRTTAWVKRHTRVRIEGDDGNLAGAVIITPHFNSIELMVAALAIHTPLAISYLPMRNQNLERLRHSRRARYVADQIDARSVKRMVKALKQNLSLQIAPDHAVNLGQHDGIIVPFFNREVKLPTAPLRLATRYADRCFVASAKRDRDQLLITLHPVSLAADSAKAARQLHQIIEREIAKEPEHYFWLHRRFKPVLNHQSDPYSEP